MREVVLALSFVLLLLVPLSVLVADVAGAQETDADPSDAESVEEPTPVPGQISDPREILDRFPPIEASKRIPVLEDNGLYPCSDCHDNEFQIANPRIRVLESMHDDLKLEHGAGRFWCLTCHAEIERDHLVSLEGDTISYDESFLLCGQCHFQHQQDFFWGAHGKQLESWQSPRRVANCTDCHDAHRPAIAPREPYPPPEVRRGLERDPTTPHPHRMPWETSDESAEAHGDHSDHGEDDR